MTSEGISHFMGINALQPQRSPVTIISSLAVENEKNNLFLDLKSLISQKCLIPFGSVCIPMHFFFGRQKLGLPFHHKRDLKYWVLFLFSAEASK